MDDIHARVAVDATARRVVMYKGEHYNQKNKRANRDSELPIRIVNIKNIKNHIKNSEGFEDLTGRKFGRFVVLGMSAECPSIWVVRCVCGRYSGRKKKSINNPQNTQDRCEHCRNLALLKRDDIIRRTGRDVDMRDL